MITISWWGLLLGDLLGIFVYFTAKDLLIGAIRWHRHREMIRRVAATLATRKGAVLLDGDQLGYQDETGPHTVIHDDFVEVPVDDGRGYQAVRVDDSIKPMADLPMTPEMVDDIQAMERHRRAERRVPFCIHCGGEHFSGICPSLSDLP